jgi:hypothetical protein
LQAQKPGDPQILQLIPRSSLLGDFPRHLVDEYIHWLNLSTGELEFRHSGSPWGPSIWRVRLQKPGTRRHSINLPSFQRRPAILQTQCKDNSEPPIRLIDVRSMTFDMVSRLVSSLESPEHIMVMLTAQTLEVSLPRLHLSFFVNSHGDLECRTLPGLIIDKVQQCGTLYGLRNKLVLCPTRTNLEGSTSLSYRRVLIPQGNVSFKTIEGFTDVFINTDAKHVHWHEYIIDTDLGCLASNLSLGSRLYQCYLHALTSHCLPDPLLGHTGTEEALYILRSAACRSFQRVDDHEATLLTLIRGLSPHRAFSKELMVKETWKDLPALSQHHDFFPIACSVLDHARALEAFYDLPANLDAPDGDQGLLNWVGLRHRSCYPSDLHISGQLSSLAHINNSGLMSEDSINFETAENAFLQALVSADVPHIFEASSQFTTNHSSRDKLASPFDSLTPSPHGASFHWQDCTSLHTVTKGVPSRASSESLEILIKEFRDSPKPLLQLYGNELNKSHRELMGQLEDTHRRTRGVVPPHEILPLLNTYHEECSRRKNKIYSKISAALSPSQNVEEISRIAGLWPRITPRSILRHLAKDRVNTLPEDWKSVIMSYAISFLRYQQSLCLLELFSKQKYDELFREIEAIRHDTLAESTPDWLLIQVRHMSC